jgi:hypothetical protein
LLIEQIKKLESDQRQRENQAKLAEMEEKVNTASHQKRQLVELIQDTPLLQELGFRVIDAQKDLDNAAFVIPATVEALSHIDGVGLRTKLTYGSVGFSYSSGGPCVTIEMRWLDDEEVFRRLTTHLTPQAVEEHLPEYAFSLWCLIGTRRQLMQRESRRLEEERKLVPFFAQKAQEWLAEWERYGVEYDLWTKREQELAWKPWTGYEIWPSLVTQNVSEPGTMPSLFVLESPADIATRVRSSLSGIAQVTVISKRGKVTKEWIPGFWRAQEQRFDFPQPEYHVAYVNASNRISEAAIYAMPTLGYEPATPPTEPLFWLEWLAANIPADDNAAHVRMLQMMRSSSAASMSKMTPETFAGTGR